MANLAGCCVCSIPTSTSSSANLFCGGIFHLFAFICLLNFNIPGVNQAGCWLSPCSAGLGLVAPGSTPGCSRTAAQVGAVCTRQDG